MILKSLATKTKQNIGISQAKTSLVSTNAYVNIKTGNKLVMDKLLPNQKNIQCRFRISFYIASYKRTSEGHLISSCI